MQRVEVVIPFREPFRPVAPVVLEEDCGRYFDLDRPSPWMMRIVDALPHTVAAAMAFATQQKTVCNASASYCRHYKAAMMAVETTRF